MTESPQGSRKSTGRDGSHGWTHRGFGLAVVSLGASLVFLTASPAVAQTYHCGDVCNTVWTAAGNPHYVTCNIRTNDPDHPVDPCTLGIAAGVEVRFQGFYDIVVNNGDTMNVLGTEAEPVIFTSDSGSPAPGDWHTLQWGSATPGTVQHAEVRYARHGLRGASTAMTIEDTTVEDCSQWGISMLAAAATLTRVTSRNNGTGLYASNAATVTVTDSTFTGNYDGIALYLGSPDYPMLTMHGSSIHSNSHRDFLADSYANADETLLDLRGNWWGTTDVTAIRSHIWDHGINHQTRPIVDWCGFLDAEGGNPVTLWECPDLLICDESASWTQTAKPYLAVSDVVVCPTGDLTIGPGVRVQFAKSPEVSLDVEGDDATVRLDVNGTQAEPVLFTSNSALAAEGDWKGIEVWGSTAVDLEHAEIEWAKHGLNAWDSAAVTLSDVDVHHNSLNGAWLRSDVTATLTDSTFHHNQQEGLEVNANAAVTATGCSFVHNNHYGVEVYAYTGGTGSLAIHDSSLHDNASGWDLYTWTGTAPRETVLDFTNNWWGTTEAAEIRANIYDQTRSTGSPIVNWCPWLANVPPAGIVGDPECADPLVCDGTVTWTVTARPYVLVTDVYVCPTGRLEIVQGVEVRSVYESTGIEIVVDGELDVRGQKDLPVTFTSDRATPTTSDWGGIRARETSATTFANATLAWARFGVWAEDSAVLSLEGLAVTDVSGNGLVLQDSASAILRDVTVHRANRGIQVTGGASVRATGCTLTDNRSYGIYADGYGTYDTDLTITTSSIHSNLGSHDLYLNNYANPETHIVWTPDNWWGTTDEVQIRGRIRDRDDSTTCPRTYFAPFGPDCGFAFGLDGDGDGVGDFEDNCPVDDNAGQADGDADGMGDPCDPAPGAVPTGDCDGAGDVADGFADADADGWGDPCDPQPTRADSYPGAVELCDARDNDGDPTTWELDELTDADYDEGIDCSDCDDSNPLIHACLCENCTNLIDDDCDLMVDGDDPSCDVRDVCIVVATGAGDLEMTIGKGACGGATLAGPYDVIRGDLGQVGFDAASVDLGPVACVAADHNWDRATDTSADPDPSCNDFPAVFFLAKPTADSDFGAASTAELRDIMDPDPACP